MTVLLFGAGTAFGQEILCAGSVKQFQVDVSENGGNGTTGSTYSWQITTAGFSGSISPLTASGNRVEIDWGTTPEGNYMLRVTEINNGCPNFQEIEISLRNEIELNELEDMYICPEGGDVTFNAGFGYDSYAWYNENGDLLGNTSQMTVDEPGIYQVEVTRDECSATQTVEAIPIDFPVFVVNTDVYNTIMVEHIGGNVDELEYQLEDLDENIIKPWQTSNTFYGINEGVYLIRIRTWDASCFTYKYAVSVNIPNTITPNGDGYNDYWDLSRFYNYAPDARVEVYDRYGKLITKISKENNFMWDGTYLGRPLPTTSYVYIMYINGEKVTGYLLIKN